MRQKLNLTFVTVLTQPIKMLVFTKKEKKKREKERRKKKKNK